MRLYESFPYSLFLPVFPNFILSSHERVRRHRNVCDALDAAVGVVKQDPQKLPAAPNASKLCKDAVGAATNSGSVSIASADGGVSWSTTKRTRF